MSMKDILSSRVVPGKSFNQYRRIAWSGPKMFPYLRGLCDGFSKLWIFHHLKDSSYTDREFWDPLYGGGSRAGVQIAAHTHQAVKKFAGIKLKKMDHLHLDYGERNIFLYSNPLNSALWETPGLILYETNYFGSHAKRTASKIGARDGGTGHALAAYVISPNFGHLFDPDIGQFSVGFDGNHYQTFEQLWNDLDAHYFFNRFSMCKITKTDEWQMV
jgi:hypothetical protein